MKLFLMSVLCALGLVACSLEGDEGPSGPAGRYVDGGYYSSLGDANPNLYREGGDADADAEDASDASGE